MNKFAFLSLLAICLHFIAISHAEESTDDWLRRMKMKYVESQQEVEKSRLERKQLEINRLKSQADFERWRILDEADKAIEKQQELAERAEQAAQEQEELTQKAVDAAEEMRAQLLQAEVKNKNQIFLGVVFLTISVFLWSVIKKYKKEGFMKDFEKFGIITILASGLLILLVLMISEPWVERFDFIQNLMMTLELHLFEKEDLCDYSHTCDYFISFPAKYAVLALMAMASYGFTTYLGITPAFKRKN